MPDKPLTVLTYAASASLAAIALVYLYNPSYILDPGAAAAAAGADSRLLQRARAVGLHNPANDCFINSVLQALAGVGGLRAYLERELQRRDADELEAGGEGRIYGYPAYADGKRRDAEELDGRAQRGEGEEDGTNGAGGNGGRPGPGLEKEWKSAAHERKVRSMLHAEVTRGLKSMLDQLLANKQATRKTITAGPFVAALESAFATRVNRNQQDAQELLQVVAERMAEEYGVGRLARERARGRGVKATVRKKGAALDDEDRATGEDRNKEEEELKKQDDGHKTYINGEADRHPRTPAVPTTALNGESLPQSRLDDDDDDDDALTEEDEGFPLQGQTSHQIECSYCGFVPSSKPTDFIMLTLSVPPKSPATLDECLDQFSKPEYIDDYKCDKCRVDHAVQVLEKELGRATDETQKETLKTHISKLKLALQTDPENPPADVPLPDSKLAPTRRIARSVKIVSFPRVLVVHLSRSSFDPGAFSSKNTAKVSFPERLKIGSLTDRRTYRLIAVITHKGTHHSGHYETFRRQHPYHLHAADLVAADTEGEGDDRTEGARSPSPNAAGATGRSAAASPDLRGRRDSEVEDEALDAMVGDAAKTRLSESSGVRRSTSRRKPFARGNLSPSSTPNLESSMATPPRTSMSAMPTPESVLEQGHEPEFGSAKPSLDAPGAAPAMERSGSRQQFRDKYEEAKGKKKEKRLRKIVARENQRWWRISDEKVRECRTQDVLEMMKEAYLLFYEMDD